jgi:hypothetical protein
MRQNLLSNKVKEEDGPSKGRAQRRPSISLPPLSPTLRVQIDAPEDTDRLKGTADNRARKGINEDGVVDLLRKQLDKQDRLLQALKNDTDIAYEFDWVRHQPPQQFHPETWVQSIDDTPELFRAAQTKKVQLRNEIQNYLVSKQNETNASLASTSTDAQEHLEAALLPPEWTKANIREQFTHDEMRFLTVVNLVKPGSNDSRTSNREAGRLSIQQVLLPAEKTATPDPGLWESGQSPPLPPRLPRPVSLSPVEDGKYKPHAGISSADEMALAFWIAHIDRAFDTGKEVIFSKLPDSLQRRWVALPEAAQTALRSDFTWNNTMFTLQYRLLNILNDSVSLLGVVWDWY